MKYRIVKKTKIIFDRDEPRIHKYYLIQYKFAFIFWQQLLRNKEGCFGYDIKFVTKKEAEIYLRELKKLREER